MEQIHIVRADRLIRLAEVETMTGIRKSLIYRLIGEGRFPPGKIVGRRARRWLERDIEGWIHA